jgi:glucose-1-phosphate thymidylyltransferase
MKGVVLAGGRGTRLRPMTNVVNKHILPVYDEPMIFYPIRTFLENGIEDILVVSTPHDIGGYIQLLEEEFDANFSYKVQKEPRGIAHAVSLAEEFVDGKFAVVLGDNIVIEDGLAETFRRFEESEESAKVFLKRVSEPARYGVAELEGDRVVEIEEKPDAPTSNHAVIGLYLYDSGVFETIEGIEPSERGELEITDVNQRYIEAGELTYDTVEGLWFDAGTPDGLLTASQYVREHKTGEDATTPSGG